MNDHRCPRCQAPLPADAPLGLCPACLLQQGFESRENASRPPGDETADAAGGGFTPPSPTELAPHFPQLEIQTLLGHGGMGAVYRARQKTLDRLVALKILPPKISSEPTFAERFSREARTLARLNHPQIVTIYDFGQADGFYFLVMEYVDGVNLRQAIQTKALTPAQALGVVPQICDALQYAHEEGVVHRDIKPENILLDKRGRVKIADFGLAKLLGRTPVELTLTASHQIMGTLHYMAPEQFERPLSVDYRADIYSLGVVFYELLTGELPLGRFPLPSERAKVDVRLDDVVLKTLERRPEARYQHASEVKTDVESIAWEEHSARAAPRRAAPTRQEAPLSAAQRDLRSAAVAMLALGAANVLLPVLAHVLIVLGAVVGALRPPDVDDFLWLFFSVPAGSIMLLGGWCMVRRMAYPLAIVGILAAMIPCGPVWLASLPVAILSILALRQPGIYESFSPSWSVFARLEPLKTTAVEWMAQDRVRPPAVTLIVLGAFNLLLPLAMNLIQVIDRGRLDDDLLPLVFSIPAGVVMIAGGVAMLRLRTYGLAVAGAVAAMLPCGPVWIVSLPVGIWALVVLRREDVQAAFAAHRTARVEEAPQVDIAAIRRQVRGPGTALAVTALVGLAVLGVVTAVWAFVAFSSPSRWGDDPAYFLLILFAWSLPWAGLMILGGWKMRHLEVYPLALMAGVAAVLPLHPLVFLTLPMGVWTLSLLFRRDVRTAFARAALGLPEEAAMYAAAAPPRKPDQPDEELRRKLTLPALGLILAGIVNALIAAGLAAAAALDLDLDLSDEVGFTLLFSSLPMGLLFIVAGTRMLQVRGYYLAFLASLLAIAPTSPAWPISIAFGMIATARLATRAMRREFEIERRRPSEIY